MAHKDNMVAKAKMYGDAIRGILSVWGPTLWMLSPFSEG